VEYDDEYSDDWEEYEPSMGGGEFVDGGEGPPSARYDAEER
jgi:hypothetical protein